MISWNCEIESMMSVRFLEGEAPAEPFFRLGRSLALPSLGSQRLHVAKANGLAQARQRITRGDELLSHVTCVLNVHQFAHDRTVLNLLGVVQFAPSRVAGRVNM